MTQCPRGGGGSAHSRESNYSGNTAFRPRETPSSSFPPPPPPSHLPQPSILVNVNINVNVHVNQEWDGYSTI